MREKSRVIASFRLPETEAAFVEGEAAKYGNKKSVFWLNLVRLFRKYAFSEETFRVKEVPSVIMSKTTLRNMLEIMTDKQLQTLAEKIAELDYQYIVNHMTREKTENVIIAMEKMKELARDYYWGDTEYVVTKGGLEVRVVSNAFVSDREKRFYEQILIECMKFLNVKFVKLDELSGTMFFECKIKNKLNPSKV